jgi:hypothetical protein
VITPVVPGVVSWVVGAAEAGELAANIPSIARQIASGMMSTIAVCPFKFPVSMHTPRREILRKPIEFRFLPF